MVERADRQPAAERRTDRGPRRRRLLDRRRPPRALLGLPGRAPHQGDAVRRLRTRAEQVRVVVPDVGGGFGVKSRTYPEEALLGFYARAARAPGALDRDPQRELAGDAAGPRPGAVRQDRRHPRRPDHRLPARRVQDAGAYPLTGAVLHSMTMRMTCGCYDIANVGFTGVSTVTNTVSITAYRGAGRPEATVAIERMVDRFAAEIGMDPAEVRRRNLIPSSPQPYTTGIGTAYDVGDYPRCARAGARQRPATTSCAPSRPAAAAAGDAMQLGIGIATLRRDHRRASAERVRLRSSCSPTAALVVRTGTTPYGQGHVTTWAMIVSDRTGVPIERIEVIHGDTDEIRSGGLTVGSRSVQLGGSAIAAASDQADRQAARAGRRTAARGRRRRRRARRRGRARSTSPARRPRSRRLGRRRRRRRRAELLAGDTTSRPPMPTFPFGTHVAVVEVDTDTGNTTAGAARRRATTPARSSTR